MDDHGCMLVYVLKKCPVEGGSSGQDQHHLFDPDPSFSNHLAGAHTLVVEGQTYSGTVQFPPIFR